MLAVLFYIAFVLGFTFMFQDVEPTWRIVVAFVVGIYELIVRIIPTVKEYSFIAKIIDIIKWISDFLSRKKKK